jgi:hypothetical protein
VQNPQKGCVIRPLLPVKWVKMAALVDHFAKTAILHESRTGRISISMNKSVKAAPTPSMRLGQDVRKYR